MPWTMAQESSMYEPLVEKPVLRMSWEPPSEGTEIQLVGTSLIREVFSYWVDTPGSGTAAVESVATYVGLAPVEVETILGSLVDSEKLPCGISAARDVPFWSTALIDSGDPSPRPMDGAVLVRLGLVHPFGIEFPYVEVREQVDARRTWVGG